MAHEADRRGIVQLASDVLTDATQLIQTEIRLVRAEIADKLERAAQGGTMLGAGAILLVVALFLMLEGVVAWLAVAGLSVQWGYLLVGLAVGGVGVILLTRGSQDLKAASLFPDKTLDNLKADLATVKEKVT